MHQTFRVDPNLESEAYFITEMELSRLYVKNDKDNPWFFLVPRKNNLVELVDLTHEEQSMLMEEISVVSEFLKVYYQPFKINVGSLGNIVRQLHIHIIARYEHDRAWPNPLWGTPVQNSFDKVEFENIRSNFLDFFD
jgi:diadenosine tetraphosphate (Ap4A) HIT family hydrolase